MTTGDPTVDAAALQVWLAAAVAEIVGVDPAEIDPDRALEELGLSSRDAVGLAGDLEELLDRTLPATLVWENPTIARLSAALLGEAPPAAEAPAAAPVLPATGGMEPIAIVGIGCRLPGGVDGPERFWEMLANGQDGVGEVPGDRWDWFADDSAATAALLAKTTRHGGFLGDVAGFDAEFFGIAPREVETMDPQQRLLLEVTWETLAQAGVPPESLRGSSTGVFVGISYSEYGYLTGTDLGRVEGYTSTGAALSIAANRISYLLDLRGPSVAVDSACSSSLVAVHQACQSLRTGEVSAALVGGVNLLLSPTVTINFDQGGALAPDGRCKTFSAAADGIARAEGCGMVLLKRLSTAERDGDRILAVVRGSAVNSDGRSNGLVAPNPAAQEAVLRSAYAAAGVDATTVDFVEAHGTGTLLGDPIEAGALGAVLGAGRDVDRPLLIGSVKTNVGHLEPAAGVAGLIKVVLAMTHDRIPPSLHFDAPNPHIPFEAARLRVTAGPTAWPRYGGLARAGVSAFGFGGTNAHVVVEEWPDSRLRPGPVTPVAAGSVAATAGGETAADGNAAAAVAETATAAAAADTLLLAGLTDARVRMAAGALADWFDSPAGSAVPPATVAATLLHRVGDGSARGAVVGRGRAELVEGLRRLSEGLTGTGVAAGRSNRPGPGPVWIFAGFGSYWLGMGRRLLAEEPAFAAALDELDALCVAEAGFSVRAQIENAEPAADLVTAQVALFAMQLALAELWRSAGVRPAAVIGHSMGEVAAAVVAGALEPADGLRVMVARARLLAHGADGTYGSMAVVDLSEPELAGLAERFPDVTIAVYGAPAQCTVAGPTEQVQALVEHVEGLDRNAWMLKIAGAGHTAAVDPALPLLAEALAGIVGRAPTVPFYSTVLDDPRKTPAFDAGYWVANLRRPVRFTQAVAAAAEDGLSTFIEVSPHPLAVVGAMATLTAAGVRNALVTGTLKRDTDDTVAFRTNLALLAVHGQPDLLARRYPRGPVLDLPRHRWQRRRYWIERAPRRPAAPGHPMLGPHLDLPTGDRHVWRADLGTDALPWAADHTVAGVPVLPVAGFAEIAVSAAAQALGLPPGRVTVSDLELEQILPLPPGTEVTTSITVTAPGRAAVEVHSRNAEGRWVRHVTARATGAPTDAAPPAPAADGGADSAPGADGGADSAPGADVPPGADVAPGADAVPADGTAVDLYALLTAAGQRYGPAFHAVTDATAYPGGRATARIDLPAAAEPAAGYHVHPALVDGCLQTLAVAATSLFTELGEVGYLPVSVGGVHVPVGGVRGGRAAATLTALPPTDPTDQSAVLGSVRLTDDAGRLLLEVTDVYLRPVDPAVIQAAQAAAEAEPATAGADDGWLGVAGLRALAPAPARAALNERLTSKLSELMGFRAGQLDTQIPLTQLGFDSLMAVRAKNFVEHDFAVQLPARLLLQGASYADFEQHIADELGLGGPRSTGPAGNGDSRPRVPPRDPTERYVAHLWEGVLGRGDLGVTEDFYALGGDPFRAGLLTAQLRIRLRENLDWTELFAVPTIEAQADLVRERLEGNGGRPVRVLRAGGTRPPLFLFHPAGGPSSVYADLVRLLGDGFPVYGMERVEESTIEAKAARYVGLMREIQPTGPYRTGGWSLGGALGYEVARQLSAAGERVGVVAMIDTIMPLAGPPRPELEVVMERFGRFADYMSELYGKPLDLPFDELATLDEDAQIDRIMAVLADAGLGMTEGVLAHQKTSYIDARLAERYDVGPYDGRVVLYRASEVEAAMTTMDPRYQRTDEALGWDDMAADLEIVKVPGNHLQLIDRPNVDVIARHLDAMLRGLDELSDAGASLPTSPDMPDKSRR